MIKPYLSIVSPVFGAEEIIDELVKQLVQVIIPITSEYEIILVEDCGPDKSWDKIVENCQLNRKIVGIKLSRNFGQHFAITAGIEKAKGDYIVVIDCDLQDDPKYIPEMYKKIKEGTFHHS